ncbi:MAG: MFS transporter [Arachnia sp.]
MSDWLVFWRLTRALRLLVFSQFAFNVGFYLVVPFLAAYLQHDLRLGGALIGIILGVRTFSQQGLFFLGGALADRFGIKPIVLLGVATRIAGFLVLALTQQLSLVILGVVLIGLAAALFSPASESGIAGLAGCLELEGGPRRTQTLSLQFVFSQAGSAVGPALGGVMLFIPFQVTCLIAAGIFGLIGLAHALWLPSGLRVGTPSPTRSSLAAVLRNRGFLAFAALNCVMLLAYNQLYLALPVEIMRSGEPATSITWYFLLASLVVVIGQSWVTRRVEALAERHLYPLGFAVTGAAFLLIAAVAWAPAPGGLLGALPIIGFVLLVQLGSMIVGPRTRHTVAVLAHEQNLGAHFGVMASVGGLAVLLASGPIGALLEGASTPSLGASAPWLVLAVPPLLAAALARPVLAKVRQTRLAETPPHMPQEGSTHPATRPPGPPARSGTQLAALVPDRSPAQQPIPDGAKLANASPPIENGSQYAYR